MSHTRIILEARSAKEGGSVYFIDQLFPRLVKLLEARGSEVEIFAGPARSLRERMRRRRQYLAADVIFHTGNRATIAPRARKIVLVRDRLLLPGRGPRPRRNLRAWVRQFLLMHALMVADEIVVPSRSMLEPTQRLRRMLPRRSNSSIHVIHHGRSGWTAPRVRPMHDPPRLLTVGLLSRHKNYPFLARVLRAAHATGGMRFRLTITLSPNESLGGPSVGDWFSEVSDQVDLIGPRPHSELEELYAAHDAFLFPSLAESFGHPLVEAMATGLPVVASDRDWAREICGDAALYADPTDPEAWLVAIGEILARPIRENRLGIERVRRFDWDRAAAEYARLLLTAS